MKASLIALVSLAIISNIIAVVLIGMAKPKQNTRIFVGLLNIALTFVLGVALLVATDSQPIVNTSEYRYQYVPIPQDSLFIKVPVQP